MTRNGENKESESDDQQNFWISVSDLMAGMVFIFLMILTVFSIQFKKEQNEFIAAKAELQSPAITRTKILNDLKDILQSEGLFVETKPEEGILRLNSSTLEFPEAKAYPNIDDLSHLAKVAKALSTVLTCHSQSHAPSNTQESLDSLPEWCNIKPIETYRCNNEKYTGSVETVMIEGHTDAMSIRSGSGYRDNLALSAARATTVLRLIRLCDARLSSLFNRKKQPILGASGYSSLRPIIEDNPRDQRNRRIDIRLMMDLPNNALEPNEFFSNSQSSRDKSKL